MDGMRRAGTTSKAKNFMDLYRKLLLKKCLAIIRWFIPLDVQKDDRSLRIAQNTVILAFLAATSVPFFAWLYHFINFDKAALIVLAGGAAMLCSPFLLKISGRIVLAREAFIVSFYGLKLYLAFYLGGIESPTFPWLVLCPMIAIALGGLRSGAIWGAIITLTFFGVYYLQISGVPFSAAPVSDHHLLQLVSILGLFFFSSIILLFFRLDTCNASISCQRTCYRNRYIKPIDVFG